MAQSQKKTVQLAVVDQGKCINCGACLDRCEYEAVLNLGEAKDGGCKFAGSCEDCPACARACPEKTARMIRDMQGGSIALVRVKVDIDPILCIGCRECLKWCPVNAIEMTDRAPHS